MPVLPTGTLTFLLTDVEGSTRHWEQQPAAMRQALVRHDALIESAVERYDGVVVRPRGEGDSRFAVFARATDAVSAAATIQQALHSEPWPASLPLRVRLALHTGEADLREGDYYGRDVNRCARLRAIAQGGQTLLSQATYDLVRDALPAGVSMQDLGERRLTDVQRAEQVYQLHVDAVRAPVPLPPAPDTGPSKAAAEIRELHRDPGAQGTRPHSAPPAPTAPAANPFFHRGPVREAAYFFGRTREMGFLADLLRQGQSVAVNGPRRLGKTSLLFHIANPTIAAAHGLAPETTRWIYLDGGSLDGLGEEWLYGAIDSALGGQDDAVPYPRLVTRLQNVTARGVRVILALDEFELVAANPHFGLAVFNRLRGLAARFPLQMVTASRDPLLDLTVGHPEMLSSPFFNIFAPLTLTLFSHDEALALLTILAERGGRPFSPRTRTLLIEEVGPHPLFLQIAGYRAFAAHDGGPEHEITDAARATVRADIAADLDQHLRYYWQSLDAEARYTLAALPLLDPEHRSPALDRLSAAGLVRGRGYLGRVLEDFVRRQVVEGLLQAGPVVMDVRRGLATVRGAAVRLTPTEFAALRLFLERRGQVLTPGEIEAALWPGEFVEDPERARGVIKKLRGALGNAGEVIVNRRGHGYLLATN